MEHSPLNELIELARKEYPGADFGFLVNSIYGEALTQSEKQNFLKFIDVARTLQIENPIFEAIYQQLLHLYVLNGSRLDVLKTIERRLRGLMEGQGALLLISGVSGIGKTSMVMAFQERIRQYGAEFVVVRCSEQESSSYALWQDVVQFMSNKGISIESLSTPIGTGPAANSLQQLRQSLSQWLNRCISKAPLVILLDDLHWADADSLEMLYQQISQSSSVPILFIATYRSEETQQQNPLNEYLPRLRLNGLVDLIHLQALNREDIERLATGYYGPCSVELADYLFKRAEGHPLFTVELLHDLISQNLLTQNNSGYWLPPEQSIPVPTVLKQLITQRVSRLDAEVEQLLTVASIAGESWQLKIIESVLEFPEEKLLNALESALNAGLITCEDDDMELYRFSHGLIREVLYTMQLARRRKQLHGRIAIQFEQQQKDNIYTIAHHFYEAENWEKAIQYGLAAGEQAGQRFALFSAVRWYQQVLKAAESVGKAVEPEVILNIYDRLGRSYRANEQRDEAETIYKYMRNSAQKMGDLAAEGRALVNLASVRIGQYQFDLAEKTANEALKIGEQTGNVQLLAQTHSCLGALLIYRGRLEQATHHLNEALVRSRTLEDQTMKSEIFKLQSYLAIWKGQYPAAESYAQNSLASAQKSTDPLVKGGGYQNLSWAQIESGKYIEAYQTILTILEAGNLSESHHHNLPRILNLMGYLHLELGDAQTALKWDQKALEASWQSQTQGNYEMRRYSLLNIATDYLHLEKPDEGQEAIVQFESIKELSASARFRYYNRYQLLMSEMYLVKGLFEQSAEFAQEARNLAESNKVLKNIAKSHWFEGLALAGMLRFDEAVGHLEKAVDIVDGIQHGSLRWKIRLSLAEVMQKTGQAPDEVIRQTRKMIDQTIRSLSGSPLQTVFLASKWIKQIEQLEHTPAPDKPTYPAGLTQREVEVLRLVATGATNQQVANVLHISIRTVNTHMTNILNKTGCDNRTAASAFAIQNNLVSK